MAKHDDRFAIGDYLLYKRENNRVYRIISKATKQSKGSVYNIFTLRSLCGEYWRTNQRSRTLRREYVCNDTVKILYGSVDDDIQLIKLQSSKSPQYQMSWVRRGKQIAAEYRYVYKAIQQIPTKFIVTPTNVLLPTDDSQQSNKSDSGT